MWACVCMHVRKYMRVGVKKLTLVVVGVIGVEVVPGAMVKGSSETGLDHLDNVNPVARGHEVQFFPNTASRPWRRRDRVVVTSARRFCWIFSHHFENTPFFYTLHRCDVVWRLIVKVFTLLWKKRNFFLFFIYFNHCMSKSSNPSSLMHIFFLLHARR